MKALIVKELNRFQGWRWRRNGKVGWSSQLCVALQRRWNVPWGFEAEPDDELIFED